MLVMRKSVLNVILENENIGVVNANKGSIKLLAPLAVSHLIYSIRKTTVSSVDLKAIQCNYMLTTLTAITSMMIRLTCRPYVLTVID